MKHLVSLDDSDIIKMIHTAQTIERAGVHPNSPIRGKILANLFYEPSTRTSSSFAAAMYRLGGNVIPINDVNYSSVSKGENLEDTIRTMGCYSDVIVLRSKNVGDAAKAASVSTVPLINAGDGSGEHPTQTLLDLYTIYKEFDRLEGLNIVLMGDLKYGRTIHSLVKVLGENNNITCISPENLKLPKKYGTFKEGTQLKSYDAKNTDVLYLTRVQKERLTKQDHFGPISYNFDRVDSDNLNSKAILLHPFPRNEELPSWFDSDPRARYFDQMQNGLYIRMAILMDLILA